MDTKTSGTDDMIIFSQICKGCQACYLVVSFLPYRVAGFCTAECSYHEPRGIPSDEAIGYKTGIAVATQRKHFAPSPSIKKTREYIPGEWTFDMVHYPRPIGWQIENWRPETCFRSDEANQCHKKIHHGAGMISTA